MKTKSDAASTPTSGRARRSWTCGTCAWCLVLGAEASADVAFRSERPDAIVPPSRGLVASPVPTGASKLTKGLGSVLVFGSRNARVGDQENLPTDGQQQLPMHGHPVTFGGRVVAPKPHRERGKSGGAPGQG